LLPDGRTVLSCLFPPADEVLLSLEGVRVGRAEDSEYALDDQFQFVGSCGGISSRTSPESEWEGGVFQSVAMPTAAWMEAPASCPVSGLSSSQINGVETTPIAASRMTVI
jgi:hypothetical protein